MISIRGVAPAWLAALAVVTWPAVSHSEEKPLWEAGLGIGALAFPDYRGSDEVNTYPVPLPYFVYRGKFLKADREGVRGDEQTRQKPQVPRLDTHSRGASLAG